jgi:hypothetical protein
VHEYIIALLGLDEAVAPVGVEPLDRATCHDGGLLRGAKHRRWYFAETAARAVADDIAAKLHGSRGIDPYDAKGSCHIEFGAGLVGKVDVDFLSGPSSMAPFLGPSRELAWEKAGSSPPGAAAGSAAEWTRLLRPSGFSRRRAP